jgi:hypothetical protein
MMMSYVGIVVTGMSPEAFQSFKNAVNSMNYDDLLNARELANEDVCDAFVFAGTMAGCINPGKAPGPGDVDLSGGDEAFVGPTEDE